MLLDLRLFCDLYGCVDTMSTDISNWGGPAATHTRNDPGSRLRIQGAVEGKVSVNAVSGEVHDCAHGN